MSTHDPISFTFDWEAALAADGSLAYVPFVGTVPNVEAPGHALVPKRSAVAPRARQRQHDGIVVMETPEANVGIVDCVLSTETRWTCTCGASFKKAGRHNGTLRTCKACGARYFLRMVPLG